MLVALEVFNRFHLCFAGLFAALVGDIKLEIELYLSLLFQGICFVILIDYTHEIVDFNSVPCGLGCFWWHAAHFKGYLVFSALDGQSLFNFLR